MVLVAIGISIGARPPVAHADTSEADKLLRLGVHLRREHRNEEALDAFIRSNAIAATPIARAQIALAEQALGRWLAASRDLDAALSAPTDEWISRNRGALEDARREIDGHLGWLTVDVDAPTAQVLVDGVATARGTEVRVPEGLRNVEVRAEGETREVRRVAVDPGAHVKVAIALQGAPVDSQPAAPPAAVAPVPRAPDGRRPSHPSMLGPLAVGGAGLVVMGVGTYFGALTFQQKAWRDGQCVDNVCNPPARDYDSEARRSATISTVAFTAGVAAVAAGAAWWWIDSRRARAAQAWRVTPLLGQTACGVIVEGNLR